MKANKIKKDVNSFRLKAINVACATSGYQPSCVEYVSLDEDGIRVVFDNPFGFGDDDYDTDTIGVLYEDLDRDIFELIIERIKNEEETKELAKEAEVSTKMNTKENEIMLLKEDLECVHMYLDDMDTPRKDVNGNVYSIVGRIECNRSEQISKDNFIKAVHTLGLFSYKTK